MLEDFKALAWINCITSEHSSIDLARAKSEAPINKFII